ncbi:MAG: hypothetical protein MI922_28750, partial [Bacteroidales bacterium]|nr:hypothetical protein [Bacteroidales bacterium]
SFNFHKKSDGYLYIKDGDNARYITNFSITPATRITKISILKEGKDWKQSNKIHPGETVDVKIEGDALHKAKFHFEDLIDVTRDTVIHNEQSAQFKLKIPADISKKRINIYNYNKPTGKYLQVNEYQRAKDFDYVYINYGDMSRRVSGIRGPILYEGTVRDVTLDFNTNMIDKDQFYGKQYIDIDVKLTDKKNNLIEMRTIKNVVVCPSSHSPRYSYYSTKDCRNDNVSLNKYLRKKTYSLEPWSRIELKVSNSDAKYANEKHEKELEIVLKKRYSFDIEVSFPAGLIIISRNQSEVDLGNLSGISMAMVAQFSFYHPDKIAMYRPYKVGAGFLALNAFNYNTDKEQRDVGLVLLGSVYPTRRDVKLSFPLYVGFGYFLNKDDLFFLVGPGIRVRL